MNLPDAHNKSTPGDDETLPPMPERIAGRYNVRGLLGRGGFGAVYEAYDELEERPVALKVIRRDASLDPPGSRSSEMPSATIAPVSHASSGRALDGLRKAQVTRSFGNTQGNAVDTVMDNFKAEFRLLTQLHHPNLAAVYDFGRCDGDVVYFTQELLSGQSLAEFLRGASRETVVEIFVQLARALAGLGLAEREQHALEAVREAAQRRRIGLARLARGALSGAAVLSPSDRTGIARLSASFAAGIRGNHAQISNAFRTA